MLRARLSVLLVAVLLLVGISGCTPSPTVLQKSEDMIPPFSNSRVVTQSSTLKYDPTGEFIFPSIVHASAYLDHPLAKWYLYYAPHERPGGISLLYSNSLAGPWTEYKDNPLITNSWEPNYSVSHVSSPDVIWNTGSKRFFVYFHGENSTTRYATSRDGVHFSYGGVAISASLVGESSTEASYARVFDNPDRKSPNKYSMFFMENTVKNHRRIRSAASIDGRSWVVSKTFRLSPDADEKNLSGANFFRYQGVDYIVYHASNGTIYQRTVDPELTKLGPRRVLFKSRDGSRAAAPELVTSGDHTYLFYESGPRLQSTIRYARSK